MNSFLNFEFDKNFEISVRKRILIIIK